MIKKSKPSESLIFQKNNLVKLRKNENIRTHFYFLEYNTTLILSMKKFPGCPVIFSQIIENIQQVLKYKTKLK